VTGISARSNKLNTPRFNFTTGSFQNYSVASPVRGAGILTTASHRLVLVGAALGLLPVRELVPYGAATGG
jgi:hypothetical protein